MIKTLTSLALVCFALESSAADWLQRWTTTTTTFSREALTNATAAGWRQKLGIGATNDIVYDLSSSSNLLYTGLSQGALDGISNTIWLATSAATNGLLHNRFTTNADNLSINGGTLSNAVDLLGSTYITVTPNANHRSWTIAETGLATLDDLRSSTNLLQRNRFTTNADDVIINGGTLTNAVDLVGSGFITVTPDANHRLWTIGHANTFTFTHTISADGSYGPFLITTVPSFHRACGYYASSYAESTVASTGGNINIFANVLWNGNPSSFGGVNVNLGPTPTANNSGMIEFVTVDAASPITYEFSVSGSSGTATVTIIFVLLRVF